MKQTTPEIRACRELSRNQIVKAKGGLAWREHRSANGVARCVVYAATNCNFSLTPNYFNSTRKAVAYLTQ